jgi:hypothetical protein
VTNQPTAKISRVNLAVSCLICVAAPPPHVWSNLFSLPEWVGWLLKFIALSAALYLLWRQRAMRKYILVWSAVSIALVVAFGWFFAGRA